MGLLDNAPPVVSKVLTVSILLGIFAVCVAMCVAPPSAQVMGPDYGNNTATALISTGDTAWMLASTALVLLQTPGVAFFYGGMMEHKNVVATMMQSVITLGIIPILFCFLGFSLAFAPDLGYPGFIGDPRVYGLMYNVGAVPDANLAPTIPLTVYLMFQTVFAVITPSLIVGAVADRVNFSALCIFICLWHLTVYCPLAHMVWTIDGLIHAYGVLDFAGGTVVHMSSGWSALMFAIYLGPKKKSLMRMNSETLSRMSPDERAIAQANHELDTQVQPANVTYVLLGAALLWFGWFGFNAGSALASGAIAGQAFLNTNLAAATAMITWLLLDNVKGIKMGPMGLCCGAVVGLVTITPAAGFVNVGAAALIGIIGAVMVSATVSLMQLIGNRYVDDTLDVFACHAIGGTTGMILTSLFSTLSVNSAGGDGAFYGNGKLLGKTILVVVILVLWLMTFTFGCLWVTDQIISLRVSDEEEMLGLDVSKHGGALPTYGEPTKKAEANGVPVVAASA